MRIRQYGLLANRVRRDNLQLCRRLIGTPTPAPIPESTPLAMARLTETEQRCCPACGRGRLLRGANLTPPELARLLAQERAQTQCDALQRLDSS
jgi:hypothetical protein